MSFFFCVSAKLECTLFVGYVDELNQFIASGDSNQPMVVVQFAKVQNLKGKTAIQNMHATRLLFNADIVEMIEFRNKLTELNVESCQPIFVLLHVPSYSLENDFLNLNPMKSLEQLIECKEDNVTLTVDVFIHSLC